VSKHTAGPWVLIRSGMRDNSAVATLEPAPETMVEPNYWNVAQVNTLRDEWEANARLIASAPVMYDQIRRLREALEAVCAYPAPYSRGVSEITAIARAALKETE
jgi:hypothetical protein